jgi:hypothetical protein
MRKKTVITFRVDSETANVIKSVPNFSKQIRLAINDFSIFEQRLKDTRALQRCNSQQ